MKAIRQAETRKILDLYNKEEISYSRMNEMFNELADEFAIEFADWLNTLEAKYLIEDSILIGELNKNPKTKELLKIFKKEKGL